MGASDYLEAKILDHVFNKAAYTAPTAFYVALFTAAPSDAGGGTECAYTSYARVETDAADWTRTGNEITNANAVEFPQATGGSETATHFAIFDNSSGGNLLHWGALASNLAISNNIQPRFVAGELDITCD